jgi:hypothetical protein
MFIPSCERDGRVGKLVLRVSKYRKRNLQHPQKPGLSIRAQFLAWGKPSLGGLCSPDDARFSRGSDPTGCLPTLSSHTGESRQQKTLMGKDARAVFPSGFRVHGGYLASLAVWLQGLRFRDFGWLMITIPAFYRFTLLPSGPGELVPRTCLPEFNLLFGFPPT